MTEAAYIEAVRLVRSKTPEGILAAGEIAFSVLPLEGERGARWASLVAEIALALESIQLAKPTLDLWRAVSESAFGSEDMRANASFHVAQAMQREGRFEEALAHFRRAASDRSLTSIYAISRFHEGCLLLQLSRFSEAAAVFDDLIQSPLPPDFPRIHVELRRICALLGSERGDEAPEHFEQAIAAAPALDPLVAASWYETAIALERAGETPRAGTIYERLVTCSGVPGPLAVCARFRLGVVAEFLHFYDRAIEHYKAAIESTERHELAQSQARWHLAGLLFHAEEYADALEHYAVLLRDSQLSAAQAGEAALKTGLCLQRTGRLEEARRQLESVAQDYRDSAHHWDLQAELALAELFQSMRDRDSARRSLQRVAAHASADVLIRNAAINALDRLAGAK